MLQCRRALKPDGLFLSALWGGNTLQVPADRVWVQNWHSLLDMFASSWRQTLFGRSADEARHPGVPMRLAATPRQSSSTPGWSAGCSMISGALHVSRLSAAAPPAHGCVQGVPEVPTGNYR